MMPSDGEATFPFVGPVSNFYGVMVLLRSKFLPRSARADIVFVQIFFSLLLDVYHLISSQGSIKIDVTYDIVKE